MSSTKSLFELRNSFLEMNFLSFLVWKETNFEFEEILHFCLQFSLMLFVDHFPNRHQVFLESLCNFNNVVLCIGIPEDKAECSLSSLFSEKSEMRFKDNPYQTVAVLTVALDILFPHIDDQYISHRQSEGRDLLLKGEFLVSSLCRICALNVKYNSVLVRVSRYPDSSCGLSSFRFLAEDFKVSAEEEIGQSTFTAVLASQDGHCVVLVFQIDHLFSLEEELEIRNELQAFTYDLDFSGNYFLLKDSASDFLVGELVDLSNLIVVHPSSFSVVDELNHLLDASFSFVNSLHQDSLFLQSNQQSGLVLLDLSELSVDLLHILFDLLGLGRLLRGVGQEELHAVEDLLVGARDSVINQASLIIITLELCEVVLLISVKSHLSCQN